MNTKPAFESRYHWIRASGACLLAWTVILTSLPTVQETVLSAPVESRVSQENTKGADDDSTSGSAPVPEPAPAPFAPVIIATKADALINDDGDGKADPGSTEKIEYTITISNTGAGATDAIGVVYSDTIDAHTTLVPGSVNTQPIADPDTYTASGNIAISLAAPGVLNNDRDPDTGNNSGLTVSQVQGVGANVGVATDTTATGRGGVKGSVTLNSNGSFTYDPPPGFVGSDGFNYTITDGTFTDTATVTVTVSQMVWFISNNAGGSNRGTFLNPFTSIASFNTANAGAGVAPDPKNGDFIALRSGTGTYAEADGVNLRAQQKLIGNGVLFNTAFTADSNSVAAYNTFATTAGTAPNVTASAGNGVDLSTDNTVRGLNVGNTSGFKINGTAVGSPIINAVNLAGTGGALNVTTSGAFGGNVTFGTFESTSSPSTNVNLVGVTGTLAVTTTATGLSGSAAAAAAVNVSGGSVIFSYPGAVSKGAGATGPLVSVSGGHSAGTLTFSGSLSATAGTGLQFDNADGTYNFSGTTALNGGDAGIDILNGSSGAFTFGSNTTITSPTGTAFNVGTAPGNPTVTYSGSITQNNAQRVINIDGTTGNTITFNTGTITGGASSTGINVANANGGSVTFSNGFSLGTSGSRLTNQAVTIAKGTGNGNGTFSLGAVSIFTNGAQGLVATDIDGTINSASATVDSSSATAINIDGPAGLTTLGMTLTKVSANGGPNGISIRDTNGSFTVTGSGGNCTEADQTCTGGLIQNTTGGDVDPISTHPSGTGIALRNASNISLTRIRVANHSNYGIDGTTVSGFTLQNSVINGVNGTNVASPFRDSSIRFDQLTGTNSITNSFITGGFQHNLLIDNQSGTSQITVSGNSIHNTDATVGDDGFQLEAELTAVVNAFVTNNSFAAHGGDHFNLSLINSADVDLTFTGNAFAGGHAIGLGQGLFILGANFNGTFNYDISNNGTAAVPLTGNKQGGMIHVNKGSGTGTFSGRVQNNFIGNAAVVKSGSEQAFGIYASARGAGGSHTTLISNNTVRQYFDTGIVTEAGEGAAALNATVTGNTVDNFADAVNSLHGIFASYGILGTDTNAVCIDMQDNLVANAGNEAQGGADIRLRKGSQVGLSVRIPGLVGSTSTDADNKITAENPTATTVSVSGSGFTGGAACTQPTLPAPMAMFKFENDRRDYFARAEDLFYPSATSTADLNTTNDTGRASLWSAISALTKATVEIGALTIAAEENTDAARSESNEAIENWRQTAEFKLNHATPAARRTEVTDQRSAVRGQKAEVRGQGSGVRAHYARGKVSADGSELSVKDKLKTENSKLTTTRHPTAHALTSVSGETVTVNIGTLRAGKSVQIKFQVTVNNPPNLTLLNPPRVRNQGTVTADGGISLQTDDPAVGGASDPTDTPVDLFDTSTSLLSNLNPSNFGDQVTFTATVNETPVQATSDPGGTVDFLDTSNGNAVICNDVPVSGGSAQCQTSILTAGTHNIRADYSGDGNFDPSQSNIVAQVVNACTPNPIVTSTADNGAGTLREALNNVCSGTTITFNIAGPGPHTITLTTGELQVAKNVTIKNNSGQSITVTNATGRAFNINSAKTAAIIGLTITGHNLAGDGGAIVNDGALTIVNSTLTGSAASADGGAIAASASATTVTLINTTVSGNSANGNGGGVVVLGGTMTSMNSTITNNKADNDNNATGTGGGIAASAGTTTLKNTIVAGNFNEDGASDATDDISGTIDAASSFNLIGNGGAGGLTNGVNNNLVGVASPGLGSLQNNGGVTFTHALLGMSTAVEAGGNANLPVDTFDLDGDANTAETLPVDQRGTGFPRNADSADPDAIQTVDIGAFELHPSVENITDKTTAEDNAIPQFSFNLGDGTGSLIATVTATSGNSTLIPNANILVGGSGTTRTLDITPAADANTPVDGTATITVTVTATNGLSATGTFDVTVTEVNDAPVPANDVVPDIGEDCSSGCTAGKYVIPFATLLGNDTNKGAANESGQTLTLTNVSLPTGGAVAINGTNVEFTPTADFSGPAGFTYTATDNGTTNGVLDAKSGNATVSFNLTGANDNPVLATNTGMTVGEGSTNNVITNSMLNVTDVDNTPAQILFTLGTATTNGALKKSGGALAGGGTFTQADINSGFITYDHNGSETTSDSFSFTVSDGAGGSISLTSFNLTVTPVNDAPVVTTTGGNLAYTENDPATVVDAGVTITDADSASLVGATVSITANFDAGKDVLSWTDNNLGDNITLSGASTAQTVILTGTDTLTNYEAALRAVKYQSASDNPSTLTRTVTFSANDGTDTGFNTRGIDVTAVNDVPSFTKGPDQTVVEDPGAQTVSNWATNISAGPEESGQTVNFIVSNNNNALFSAQPAVDSTGTLTYTPAANAFGSATVDVQIHDNGGGLDTSAVQQFTITVTAVADTPSVTNTTTLEDTPSNTNLVITRNAADSGEVTHFKITNILNGQLFKHDGSTQINNGDFILVAEAANVGGFGLVFKPSPDFNGNTGTGNFDIQASTSGNNAGLGGGVITATITVTPVNDTPSFTKGPDINVNANSGAHSFPGWATNIARGPATATDETGQTVNFIVSNNNNGLFSVQPAVDSSGQLTFTVAAAAFGQATVSVQIHDNGGGADTSAVQQFIITVTSVDLTPTKSHVGPWKQGDTGKTYTISVKNIGQDASVGLVTLADSLPAGLIARSLSGTGWTCDPIPGGGTAGPATLNCTRSDALAGGVNATYPDITLTVDIACNAPANVTNSATVSGGNDASPANNTSADATVINPDNIPPVIVCPGGISKYTDSGQNTATINVQPAVATDNCGNVTVTGVRSDGKPLNAPFPKGITIITWTAKDAANNTATCAQSITVMVPSSPHRIPGDEPDEEALLIVTDLVMTVLSAVW